MEPKRKKLALPAERRVQLKDWSRRDLLRGGLLLGPLAYFAPGTFLRSAFAQPSAAPRNLILLELFGGNDGYNTFVPFGVSGGTYYSEFRKHISVAENTLLKVPNNNQVGFHPSLAKLFTHFQAGRVAICQGVSYPNPSYSHDYAAQIWAKGDPTAAQAAGWLARVVNQHPAAFPTAADLFDHLTPPLLGSTELVPAVQSIDDFRFPTDDNHSEDAQNLRAAYQSIVGSLASAGGKAGTIATTAGEVLDLIDAFGSIPEFTPQGTYPQSYFSQSLQLAVQLLKSGLGTRYIHLGFGGFDTHSGENDNGYHAKLLDTLSTGLDGLYTDLVASGLADSTLVVVFTEFGRTVYDNGSGGTDHGSVEPVIVFGNPVNGGFVNAHPGMDPSTDLTQDGELKMAIDFRDVLGTVATQWLQENPATIFPGYSVSNLGFIA